MRSTRLLLALQLLTEAAGGCTSASASPDTAGPWRRGTLRSGGLERSYTAYVPRSARRDEALPVVVAFHGAGGRGSDMQGALTPALAEQYRFLAVYPDAAPDTRGTWALGCRHCTHADARGIDDYAFVRDLLDTLAARHPIDARRVFAIGHSLGGSMAFDLACRGNQRLAGVAVVASLPSADELPFCRPGRALDVLIIIGDRDPNVPWSGGGAYAYASADSTARLWATWNGCRRGVAATTGYESCRDGVRVVLVRVAGGGHEWPRRGVDASAMIMEMFLR